MITLNLLPGIVLNCTWTRQAFQNENTNENNFLGFVLKDPGLLDTHVIGEFGIISEWPHLQRLLHGLDLNLIWERNTYFNK